MIRQYIGARYVPKFSGVYDPTKEYSNLEVVDNGVGTSYISKKIVPPNTPLTDTEYWAIYGASSGAIIDIQNQINEIKKIAVTPEMFGAVGDGTTDDTIAVQNALDNGGIVVMDNSYKITSGLTVPNGVDVVGDGNIVVHSHMYVFTLSGNNIIDGLNFTDDTELENEWAHIYGFEVDNVTVKNCHFDTIGMGYAVLFDHSTNIHILDNEIKDYSFGGIMFFHTCKNAEILRNKLYNSRWRGADHNYPICFSGYQDHDYGPAENIQCNYNIIEEVSPWWEGIDTHACNNYEVIGNIIKNCFKGIACGYKRTGGTGFARANCNAVIENNFIITALPSDATLVHANGIFVAGGDGSITENLEIRNNRVETTGRGTGVAAGSAAIAVTLGDGIGRNIIISNNFISATNMVSIGYGASGATNCLKIIGNYFNKIIGSGYAVYAIYANVMNNHSGVVIEDNVCNTDIVNDPTVTRFIRCTANAPINHQLVEYKNNGDNGLQIDTADYMTSPKAALPLVTQAQGIIGQFIPSTAAGVIGYYCKGANNWVTINA